MKFLTCKIHENRKHKKDKYRLVNELKLTKIFDIILKQEAKFI